jgi:hypothetical protein
MRYGGATGVSYIQGKMGYGGAAGVSYIQGKMGYGGAIIFCIQNHSDLYLVLPY